MDLQNEAIQLVSAASHIPTNPSLPSSQNLMNLHFYCLTWDIVSLLENKHIYIIIEGNLLVFD